MADGEHARECTETLQYGHVRAFESFGGVPSRISYDNAKTSVSQIIGAHARRLTNGFLQLQSHYLFEELFCQVRRPNDKSGNSNGYSITLRNHTSWC